MLPLTTACFSSATEQEPWFDELVIAFPESGADPWLGLSRLIAAFTLEGLTQVRANGRAEPRLAEEWLWEDGGLRLRARLRENVLFHDGTPLTPDLAARILNRAILDPQNLALYPSLGDITDIRPDNDRDVVIHLSRHSAFLPDDLEVPLSLDGDSIGTGAYRLRQLDRESIVLERHVEYYLGRPWIQRIQIRPFDTLRTAWASLLRGEVDVVTDVPAGAVEFVENATVRVISFSRRYQFLIAFNSRSELFGSAAVRRALNLAIDRDAIIEDVLHGAGSPGTGPIWPGHWAYNDAAQPYRFDPAAAVVQLDDAGYPLAPASDDSGGSRHARLRFTCLVPANFSVAEHLALHLQRQLHRIGVDMQIEVVSRTELNDRISAGRFEAVLFDMIGGPSLSRPHMFWRSAEEFSGINLFGYENAEAERLFGLLRSATNETAVRSATRRLQQVFLEDPPALFLAWDARARAVRRDIEVYQEDGRDPLFTLWRWAPRHHPAAALP